MSSISKYFHTLFSLISLQIKNKSSLSFKNNTVSAIIKTLVYIALFSGLTTGCYFLFSVFQNDSIFGILVVPLYFFNFVFITIFLLITITTIFKFKNDLYFAPDNQLLLMLPATKNQLFLSKIIVCYLLDFLRNFLFICPIFIAYGILNKFVPIFYIWLIFVLIFVLMVPVCVASIFSIVIFYIQIWLQKHYVLKNITITLILLTLFIGLIVLCTYIPKELRIDERWQTVILPHLKKFVLGYEKVFYLITCFSMLILGYTNSAKSPYRLPIFTDKTAFIFICIILFIALCIAINLLVFKHFFIATISRSSEHTKSNKSPIFKYSYKKISYYGIFIYKNKKALTQEEYHQLLNELYESESYLFNKSNYGLDKYLELLKKHHKDLSFSINKIVDLGSNCLALIKERNSTRLIVYDGLKNKKLLCYDPYRFENKNKKLPSIIALSKKNVISDFRNSYDLFINAITILVPSVCVFAANTIFSSLRLTIFGGQLVFTFTLLAILLFLTFYASIASSLYSKSQKNAYVLNVSPFSKFVNIFMSIFHLFIIGFISIILLTINYSYTTPLKDVNIGFLFITLLAIFTLLLVVNASIDLFSLKNNNFTASTSEKAGEQNELYALITSLIIITIFTGLGFLFFRFDKDNACLYLMFIALLVLIVYCLVIFISSMIKKYKKRKLAL